MKIFKKIIDIVVLAMMILSTATVFCVSFAQVISRFVFSLPIPWASDIIRIAFIYAVLFGASYAAKFDDHLSLDVILSALKPKMRQFLKLLIYCLIVGFLIFLIKYGFVFAFFSGASQRLPYLPWPMTNMYIAIPIGAIIMALYYLQHIVITISGLRKNKVFEKPEE